MSRYKRKNDEKRRTSNPGKTFKRKNKKEVVRTKVKNDELSQMRCPITDEMIRQTWLISARLGGGSQDIADVFGAHLNTVNYWIKRGKEEMVKGNEENQYARFVIALKSGTDSFHSEQIEEALVKRANGYTINEHRTEKTTVSLKELRKLGIQVPESLVEEGTVVTARKETVTEKEVPPDTAAIRFFLQNRAGNRWKNVSKKEVNIKGGVDHRHLHGFVNGIDPALAQERKKLVDPSKLSDEKLKMLEEIQAEAESSDEQISEVIESEAEEMENDDNDDEEDMDEESKEKDEDEDEEDEDEEDEDQ